MISIYFVGFEFVIGGSYGLYNEFFVCWCYLDGRERDVSGVGFE